MNQVQFIEIGENMIQFPITVAGQEIMFQTHAHPHADEASAVVLLTMFGTKEWLRKYAPNGSVEVGIGDGQFNEHANPQKGILRAVDECAVTLVAKTLPIEDKPHVKIILDYVFAKDVNNVDVDTKKHGLGLGTAINLLRRVFPNFQIKNLNWAVSAFTALFETPKSEYLFSLNGVGEILNNYYKNIGQEDLPIMWENHILQAIFRQKEEFQEALQEIVKKGKIEEIKGHKGQKLTLLVIESDMSEIAKAGRFGKGVNADIIVQKKSNGQVMVHTKTQARVKLFSLFRILNLEEQLIRKIRPLVTRNLTKEGNGPGNIWYFQCSGRGGHFILNGSLSTPNIEPTKIPLEKIVEYLKISLDNTRFPEDWRFGCVDKKSCTSTSRNPCPWWLWSLPRCLEIRANEII